MYSEIKIPSTPWTKFELVQGVQLLSQHRGSGEHSQDIAGLRQ